MPILQNGFVEWDDGANLVQNPKFRGLGWEQLKWMFTTFHMGHYQPLSWITLACDYLVWGLEPFGYHLTNLLIHSASTVLFYFISRQLLAITLSLSDAKSWQLNLGAAASALFFGIHPLRVESVAWATERRDVLSGFFYLLTLYSYLGAASTKTASRKWLRLSFACYAFSLLSKATAITLPVVLLILDIYPLKRLPVTPRAWFKPQCRAVLMEKVPFSLLAAVFAVVALLAQHSIGTLKTFQQYDLISRLGQMAYGHIFYLGKMVLPTGLSPIYELPFSSPSWKAWFFLCAAGAVAFTIACYCLRRRWPALLACWLYYVITLAPVSGIAQSGPQLVADRYSYLSTLSFSLLLGGIVARVWPSPIGTHRIRLSITAPAYASLLLVLLVFATLTWRQSRIWRNTRTLWQHAIAVTPTSSIAYYNLGKNFENENNPDRAIEHYRRALAIDRGYYNAHHNLAGLLVGKGLYGEALGHFRAALEIKPDDADTHNNLGVLFEMQGDPQAALREFQNAVDKDPNYARGFFNIGRVLAQQGELAGAVNNYQHAARLDPNEAMIRLAQGEVLARQNKLEDAVAQLEEAIKLKPELADAHLLLARILAAQGKKDEAEKHYRTALRVVRQERKPGSFE